MFILSVVAIILVAFIAVKKMETDSSYIDKLRNENKLMSSKLQLLQYAKNIRNEEEQ